ncbi:hypothetical protein ACLOJK_008899 [Asimina triloba]
MASSTPIMIMICILAASFLSAALANADVLIISVADFGAKGDGKTDATQAFLQAWSAACTSTQPTTFLVPARNKYLLGPVELKGPCNNTGITIRIEGILVAPPDYRQMQSEDYWIRFSNVQGVSVIGGYLNGQGLRLWACKAAAAPNCPSGTTSLAFFDSKDISISGLTSINSELYHIAIDSSSNVAVDNVRIYAPKDSPNTDGIHVEQSTDVRIVNAGIKTGDDCISIGPGTQNLWIEHVACGPGHGISIGSLGKALKEDGVENVTVKSVVFNGTQNGLRIKSWARPSDGFVKGVMFENAVMINVDNPIIIDQNYCPHNQGCPGQDSGVKISEVTYKNIRGTSTSKLAMTFDCSPSAPCDGIELQDIKLTFGSQQQVAQSLCKNVEGATNGLITPPGCF